MSFDVFLFKLPSNIKNVKDIGGVSMPEIIGNHDTITDKIKTAIPETVFRDKKRGVIEKEKFSIEINLGEINTDCISLHIRGSKESLEYIDKIMQVLSLKVIDGASGFIVTLRKTTTFGGGWSKEFK